MANMFPVSPRDGGACPVRARARCVRVPSHAEAKGGDTAKCMGPPWPRNRDKLEFI